MQQYWVHVERRHPDRDHWYIRIESFFDEGWRTEDEVLGPKFSIKHRAESVANELRAQLKLEGHVIR